MHANGAAAVTLYDFIDQHYLSLYITSWFFSAVTLMTVHDIAMAWIQSRARRVK